MSYTGIVAVLSRSVSSWTSPTLRNGDRPGWASRIVRISPEWPLWAVAIGVAAVVELIFFIYRYESGAISAVRAKWSAAFSRAFPNKAG